MLRLTRNQSREVDRIAIEEFGIPSIVLMENAARGAVDAMRDLLPKAAAIGVMCGPGNNGGDGLAVARHLVIRGHRVFVLLTAPPPTFSGDAAINLNIALKLRIPVKHSTLIEEESSVLMSDYDLLIDAVFGTGLNRPPNGPAKAFIRGMNRRGLPFKFPLVSLDVPSGLDCDTGNPLGECVRATRTITFGSEKVGFAFPHARAFTGDVVVADVGVPQSVIDRAAASPP